MTGLEHALRIFGHELVRRSASYSEQGAIEAMVGIGDAAIATADVLQQEREAREAGAALKPGDPRYNPRGKRAAEADPALL